MIAFKPGVQSFARLFWALALLALPVTSFRWFPLLGEGTLVRPLALYPLVLLFPCLIILAFRGLRRFPRSSSVTLLIVFAFAALSATLLGAFIDPVLMRGQTYVGRAVRAFATLLIGILFYISAAWMNQGEDDLRFTLRWLLAGFVLDLAWSGIQALAFYTPLLPKQVVTHWQLVFSMRELVRTNRVSGLAYEPAWLAGQIATIYLPFLFASLVTGVRLTSRKWLEPLLLVLALLLILATYSRGGLLVALGAAFLTFILLGRSLLAPAWGWFTAGFRNAWLSRLSLLAAFLLIVIGTFLFLGQKNYFRRLWDFSPDNLTDYIVNINAGARSAYATGAMAAYQRHPLMGVGLGAAGFWIYGNLPDWSLTTVPEIARQLDPGSHLYPNPKNMYVRLLAETGLVGFVLYLVFLFSSLADALDLLRRRGLLRLLGVAGFFAWSAIALYNVIQDSFATPNIWLIMGMLAGAAGALHSNKFHAGQPRRA